MLFTFAKEVILVGITPGGLRVVESSFGPEPSLAVGRRDDGVFLHQDDCHCCYRPHTTDIV